MPTDGLVHLAHGKTPALLDSFGAQPQAGQKTEQVGHGNLLKDGLVGAGRQGLGIAVLGAFGHGASGHSLHIDLVDIAADGIRIAGQKAYTLRGMGIDHGPQGGHGQRGVGGCAGGVGDGQLADFGPVGTGGGKAQAGGGGDDDPHRLGALGRGDGRGGLKVGRGRAGRAAGGQARVVGIRRLQPGDGGRLRGHPAPALLVQAIGQSQAGAAIDNGADGQAGIVASHVLVDDAVGKAGQGLIFHQQGGLGLVGVNLVQDVPE